MECREEEKKEGQVLFEGKKCYFCYFEKCERFCGWCKDEKKEEEEEELFELKRDTVLDLGKKK